MRKIDIEKRNLRVVVGGGGGRERKGNLTSFRDVNNEFAADLNDDGVDPALHILFRLCAKRIGPLRCVGQGK